MSLFRRDKTPRRAYAQTLVSGMQSTSTIAESYRMLRTNLVVGAPDVRRIVVTSAGRGEGKSITCANLALVLSQSDRSVALVDADLRIPSTHQVFNLPLGTPNIGQALKDPTSLEHVEECMVQVAPDLQVLPAAQFVPEYPSEILGSRQFGELLATLGAAYDYVIVDTAPVGLVTDAVVASQHADGVLFVIDHERASRRFVQRSIGELRKAGRNIVGTVLNRYPTRGGDSYVLGGEYYRDAEQVAEQHLSEPAYVAPAPKPKPKRRGEPELANEQHVEPWRDLPAPTPIDRVLTVDGDDLDELSYDAPSFDPDNPGVQVGRS